MVMTSTENVEQLPGSTKSSLAVEKNSEEVSKIDHLIAEGYRLYLSKEYEESAEKLGQANELAVELYGQFAPECFKPHFYYGMALLEIARNEATLVKTPGAEEDQDEEENEDAKEEGNEMNSSGDVNNEHGAENANNEEQSGDNNGANIAEDNSTQDVDNEEQPQQQNLTTVDETLRTEFNDEAEEMEEEDPGTEVLAWESLEVARKICEKLECSSGGDWMEKKAEVLVALSDCMIISEEYDVALKDLNTALEIQKKLYGPHDRRIAETLYHIGRCHRNSNEFQQAAESFDNAGVELQHIVDSLEESVASSEDSAIISKAKDDINNLQAIIAEIKESAQDARESEVARKKQLEEQRTIVESVFTQILSGDTITNDITNLVRKSVKRQVDSAQVSAAGDTTPAVDSSEPTNGAAPDLKKQKLDNVEA